MRIGLALSGGGVRATAFHIGVLARLAAAGQLESVTSVSSVSGGSLAVGLAIARSQNRWPSSEEFLASTLPQAQAALTGNGLQRGYVRKVLRRPWSLARGRASDLAAMLRTAWEIRGSLCDLPERPIWAINATTYETGKSWRFRRDRMGDYLTQYVPDPDFFLADAMAASAAVPGLIGPLTLRAANYSWHAYQADGELAPTTSRFRKLRLWDGGVYDNLGTEPLFKEGLREGIEFLIVSDASRPVFDEAQVLSRRPPFYLPPFRLIDVATDQVRSLRARWLVSYFDQHPGTGVLLRLGNTRDSIFRKAGQSAPAGEPLVSDEECRQSLLFETTLRTLTAAECQMLIKHGYEVADATLTAYAMEQPSISAPAL
jgi:NTE family protein